MPYFDGNPYEEFQMTYKIVITAEGPDLSQDKLDQLVEAMFEVCLGFGLEAVIAYGEDDEKEDQ